jgi:hypothetical protein
MEGSRLVFGDDDKATQHAENKFADTWFEFQTDYTYLKSDVLTTERLMATQVFWDVNQIISNTHTITILFLYHSLLHR